MIHQLIMELEEDLQHQPFSLQFPQGEQEVYLYHDDDDEEEDDDDNTDTLSLCDLPMKDAVQEPKDTNSSSSYQEDFFEFFTLPANSNSEITTADQVISCGKLIPYKQQPIKITDTKTFQSKRSPLRAKQSLKQHSPTMMASPTRHQQQHGMKYSMIVFGFGKNIPTEMGLSDIRKRQSRLTPKPLVPTEDDGGKICVAGNGFEKQGKGKWGLMKSLFGSRRSHYGISAVLTRSSFNCLSVV